MFFFGNLLWAVVVSIFQFTLFQKVSRSARLHYLLYGNFTNDSRTRKLSSVVKSGSVVLRKLSTVIYAKCISNKESMRPNIEFAECLRDSPRFR